ncbi:hypothetical protein GQ54DRAFT_204262 [Martensiomyces pterosporus]|nr:hypothetical protein GQ54DRAFT_204262 [Martensiomyces pterosporus]
MQQAPAHSFECTHSKSADRSQARTGEPRTTAVTCSAPGKESSVHDAPTQRQHLSTLNTLHSPLYPHLRSLASAAGHAQTRPSRPTTLMANGGSSWTKRAVSPITTTQPQVPRSGIRPRTPPWCRSTPS